MILCIIMQFKDYFTCPTLVRGVKLFYSYTLLYFGYELLSDQHLQSKIKTTLYLDHP